MKISCQNLKIFFLQSFTKFNYFYFFQCKIMLYRIATAIVFQLLYSLSLSPFFSRETFMHNAVSRGEFTTLKFVVTVHSSLIRFLFLSVNFLNERSAAYFSIQQQLRDSLSCLPLYAGKHNLSDYHFYKSTNTY